MGKLFSVKFSFDHTRYFSLLKILFVILLPTLILFTGCKKKEEDVVDNPDETVSGNIDFFVFLKDFSTKTPIGNLEIKVGASHTKIVNNVLIATLTTDAQGKAKMSNLVGGTYYYQIVYNLNDKIYLGRGFVHVNQNKTYYEEISLKQVYGKATLKFKVVYPPAGADSLAKNAGVYIDYSLPNLTKTPMASGITDNDGIVIFNDLKPDTIWARFITSIGTTNFDYSAGVVIVPTDKDVQYRVVLQ